MTDDPFLQLVCDALGLMNRALLERAALPADAIPEDYRAAVSTRKYAEAPFVWEFYHQFRKLWDRGIPVGMGLGHLVVRTGITPDLGRVPDLGAPADLCVHRLGEGGQPERRVAALAFLLASNTGAIATAFDDLPWYRIVLRFDHVIAVILGAGDPVSLPTPPDEVTLIDFDTARWTATVIGT